MRPEPGLLLVRSARVFQPVQVRAKGALRRRDISGRVGTDDVRPPEFLYLSPRLVQAETAATRKGTSGFRPSNNGLAFSGLASFEK
jgi:hypothetical protein